MSSAFGGASSLGIVNKLNPSTDTGDSTNTQQNADLVSGLQNAAMATGSNTSSNVAVQPTPSVPAPAAPSTNVSAPTGRNLDATPATSTTAPASTGTLAENQGLPTAPLLTGSNTEYTTQAIAYYNTHGYLPPPSPADAANPSLSSAIATENQILAGLITASNPSANVQTFQQAEQQSSNTAENNLLNTINSEVNNMNSSNAAAAQLVSDSQATAALASGFANAGSSNAATAAAAAANSQLYRDTITAAHGAGVWGNQAANAAQGGNAAIAAGNMQLGQQTDLVNNLGNQAAYLSTTLQSELQNHTIDAQTAIANMNTTISAITAELGEVQGQDAIDLKGQLNDLNQQLAALQNASSASALGNSEIWGTLGTIASVAAKVVPSVTKALGTGGASS